MVPESHANSLFVIRFEEPAAAHIRELQSKEIAASISPAESKIQGDRVNGYVVDVPMFLQACEYHNKAVRPEGQHNYTGRFQLSEY